MRSAALDQDQQPAATKSRNRKEIIDNNRAQCLVDILPTDPDSEILQSKTELKFLDVTSRNKLLSHQSRADMMLKNWLSHL